MINKTNRHSIVTILTLAALLFVMPYTRAAEREHNNNNNSTGKAIEKTEHKKNRKTKWKAMKKVFKINKKKKKKKGTSNWTFGGLFLRFAIVTAACFGLGLLISLKWAIILALVPLVLLVAFFLFLVFCVPR